MPLLKAMPVSRVLMINVKVPETVLDRAEYYAHFAKLGRREDVFVQAAIHVMDADAEFLAYMKTNPELPKHKRGPKPIQNVAPANGTVPTVVAATSTRK